MTSAVPLVDLVREFGDEVANRVKSVLGHDDVVMRADSMDTRFVVRSDEENGIPLYAGGRPLLRLDVNFNCEWDGPETYLAVKHSAFVVRSITSKEPLFRYEWVKDAGDSIPCAHLQVHAHRDALTHSMYLGGKRTARAKRRTRDDRADDLVAVSALHFPVGGPRMRPALEDVLEMLIEEFGLDAAEDWKQQLAEGREGWRRRQIRASVRDAPQDAAEVLRSLGYKVERPQQLPGDSRGILRRY